MGSMSLVHWIIVGAVLLVLFGGRGKISDVMGDVAKGIKSFKKGLSDDEPSAAPRPVEPPRAEPMRSIDQERNNSLREPVARETSETRQVG